MKGRSGELALLAGDGSIMRGCSTVTNPRAKAGNSYRFQKKSMECNKNATVDAKAV
jgi:hypothetical protein